MSGIMSLPGEPERARWRFDHESDAAENLNIAENPENMFLAGEIIFLPKSKGT
jgi:hypothetical protein